MINYLGELLQCFILIGIIYFGTRLVNYYYNFYHIYKYLNQEQKLGYFKNNYLVNIITKNNIVKKIIVKYILIPIIKINYVFILLFITLLYSLCHSEFNDYIKNENILYDKYKKDEKNKFDKQTDNIELIKKNTNLENLNGELVNVQNITDDYNQNISDIMNFLSNRINDKESIIDKFNELDKLDITHKELDNSINNIEENFEENSNSIFLNNNTNNKEINLNLLDEINMLSIKENNINVDISNNYEITSEQIINQSNLPTSYLNPNPDTNIPKHLEDYLIINSTLESNQQINTNKIEYQDTIPNDEINIDEIDFGMGLEQFAKTINYNNSNLNSNLKSNLNSNSQIIRIGKKKKENK